MKQLVLLVSLIFQVRAGDHPKREDYFKFNTCEFKKRDNNTTYIRDIAIIKYSIVNNRNKKRDSLSAYYLIRNSKDTFNVIHIFNTPSSDSIIKEYRWSENWNFKSMRDTCVVFYSQINLKKEIDCKYPILFGQLFVELD